MNAALIYQMPVNNRLEGKSWPWDIFTHVILGEHTKYESVLEHLYYVLQFKRDLRLTINTQLTLKILAFLHDCFLSSHVWSMLHLFLRKKILYWKQIPICATKMAACMDWTWFEFIWAKQWNRNIGWNKADNPFLTEVPAQFPQTFCNSSWICKSCHYFSRGKWL